ncbi:MAG: helix-hairpin-helix domain-containing protein [Bacteroidota bacterium]
MKPLLPKYFEYTRSERLGVSFLILIGVFLLVFPTLLSFLFPRGETDFSAFQKDIAAFEEQQKSPSPKEDFELFAFDPNKIDQAQLMQLGLEEKVANTFIKYRKSFGGFKTKEDLKKVYGLKDELYQKWLPYIEIEQASTSKNGPNSNPAIARSSKASIELFPFDPNTATQEELKKLGMPNKMIRNLLNYRSAKGHFDEKEDLKQLYSFTEEEYNRLVDYIIIEPKEKSPQPIAANDEFTAKGIPASYNEVSRPKVIIDINKATTEEWQQLRGIGSAYANRIVKFRNALGGFSSVKQISETYNLPDSTYQSIRLSLRPSPILNTLKINDLTATELKNHPYINWKMANIIINYRKQHGAFSSLEDLSQIKILTEDWLKKMEPYLEY